MQSRLRTLGQGVWAWTLGGLPGWFVLPGAMPVWSHPLRLDSLPPNASDVPNGAALDLLLGPDLLLEKPLVLPVAARSNLAKAIDLNMRQTLPGGGADLLWRYGAGTREGGQLKIPVYLLKKSTLTALKATIEAQNASLRSVRVAGDASTLPFLDNRKELDRPRRAWGSVAAALVVVLVGLFVSNESAETKALHRHIHDLEDRKSTLSAQAVALRARLDAENTSFAAISRDLEIFQADYHRLPILLDLAETLRDDTWVSDLAISGPDLRLSGFTARDVTEVMANIRTLPWVQRVDLDGPVSFDSYSRRNRFDLLIRMRPVAGGPS